MRHPRQRRGAPAGILSPSRPLPASVPRPVHVPDQQSFSHRVQLTVDEMELINQIRQWAVTNAVRT